MSSAIRSFSPIEPTQAKILILGSAPSVKSLEETQYYAHKQNAFWWIMGELLNINLTEKNYQEKTVSLKQHGIALWDTLASCRRSGSLDSNIESGSIIINDIPALLKRQPSIRLIACNGNMSATLFKRHIAPLINQEYKYAQLPSTSPAHARLTREAKRDIWKEILAPYLA